MNEQDQSGLGGGRDAGAGAAHDAAHRAASGPGSSWWLQEMVEQLLWVRLLRVPAFALRPQRVGMSVFLVALVGMLGQIRMPWRDAETPVFLDAVVGAKFEALAQVWRGVIGLHWGAVMAGFEGLMVDVPRMAIGEYPVESVVLGLPMVVVWAVLGGAVCRSVACEVSLEMTLPWTKQLGFALRRWMTFVGTSVVPGAIVGLIAVVLAIGGAVLFNAVPGLELVGGVVFGLGLVLGLVAAGLVVMLVLGWPMLLPAAACEGTDAIDAVGRVLAYVVARPVRLLAYVVLGSLVVTLAGGVAWGLAEGAIGLTRTLAGVWASPEGIAEIWGVYPAEARLNAAGEVREIGGLAGASSWMVGFWCGCLRLVAAGYVVSCVLTAGTMVYLFMRQVCDGQHYAELWTEG